MPSEFRIRAALGTDAESIAMLHANSWRRHYRGAYSDEYLDGDVESDRRRVWTERLATADAGTVTLLAEDADGPVGFVHVRLDADTTWGSLVDNLHVSARSQRGGVGSRLMTAAARPVVERGTALYLWVLEQNVDAQAFYRARGAEIVERQLVTAPPGAARRLVGEPGKLRCAWSDTRVLLDRS